VFAPAQSQKQGGADTLNGSAARFLRPTTGNVVQGPGAGPEVTAAGVLADVLQIAGRLAVPS
jgi:homoserine dehydrogenase